MRAFGAGSVGIEVLAQRVVERIAEKGIDRPNGEVPARASDTRARARVLPAVGLGDEVGRTRRRRAGCGVTSVETPITALHTTVYVVCDAVLNGLGEHWRAANCRKIERRSAIKTDSCRGVYLAAGQLGRDGEAGKGVAKEVTALTTRALINGGVIKTFFNCLHDGISRTTRNVFRYKGVMPAFAAQTLSRRRINETFVDGLAGIDGRALSVRGDVKERRTNRAFRD